MKKWILTEKESKDPSYEFTEKYNDLKTARQRLHNLYVNNTQDQDSIERAEISERSAIIRFNDGNELSWDIEEVDNEPRYRVWSDSESEKEVHKDFFEPEKAYNYAVDFVHQYDGENFRVIVHVEDLLTEETIDTVENFRKE